MFDVKKKRQKKLIPTALHMVMMDICVRDSPQESNMGIWDILNWLIFATFFDDSMQLFFFYTLTHDRCDIDNIRISQLKAAHSSD